MVFKELSKKRMAYYLKRPSYSGARRMAALTVFLVIVALALLPIANILSAILGVLSLVCFVKAYHYFFGGRRDMKLVVNDSEITSSFKIDNGNKTEKVVQKVLELERIDYYIRSDEYVFRGVISTSGTDAILDWMVVENFFAEDVVACLRQAGFSVNVIDGKFNRE